MVQRFLPLTSNLVLLSASAAPLAQTVRFHFSDSGRLLVRAAAGLTLFALHGAPKLAGAAAYWFQGQEWSFIRAVDHLGFPWPALFATLAALAESVSALGLVVGLFARLNALGIALTMLVAIYRHVSTGSGAELAFLYLILFLGVLLLGPGQYSIDAFWANRKRRPGTGPSAAYERVAL